MQAVILAAGKGTRMGDVSLAAPKPMQQVNGKNLLELKMQVMPPEIDEVVLIIGYMGDKIRSFFGGSFGGRKITYVEVTDLNGTGGCLWQAKEVLGEHFLVLMGDDIYSGNDMEEMLKHEWAILGKRALPGETGDRLLFDEHGKLSGFMNGAKYILSFNEGGLMNTGVYTLSKKIFDYPLVKLKTKDEYGLPQTMLGAVNDIDLKIIETDFWIQITSPEDLKKAEEILK